MSRFHRVDLSAALAETVLERHAETLLSDQDYRLQVRIGRFSKTAITALGIRDLDVITSVAILVKVMEKHGLKPSMVESLKELILEPVAVYKSATERESIVMVTAEMRQHQSLADPDQDRRHGCVRQVQFSLDGQCIRKGKARNHRAVGEKRAIALETFTGCGSCSRCGSECRTDT